MIKGFYNQNMKKSIFVLILLGLMAFVAPVFADPPSAGTSIIRNGIVEGVTETFVTMKYFAPDPKQTAAQAAAYPKYISKTEKIPIDVMLTAEVPEGVTKASRIQIGTHYSYSVSNPSSTSPSYGNFSPEWSSAAVGGFGVDSDGSSTMTYNRIFNILCPNERALECWIGQGVLPWAQGAILLLSIGAFVIAGIIYMTSAGSPKQIEMAKKIIVGALSGIAVMILGRFFLTTVIGVPWL